MACVATVCFLHLLEHRTFQWKPFEMEPTSSRATKEQLQTAELGWAVFAPLIFKCLSCGSNIWIKLCTSMRKMWEERSRLYRLLLRVSQPGPVSVLCSPMSRGRFGQRGQQKCPSIDAEDGNTERDVCHLMEMRVMIWDAASVSASEHASSLPQP